MLLQVLKGILFSILLLNLIPICSANVGLLVVATGKYTYFAEVLIQSARSYFCPGHHVTYYVFTDRCIEGGPDIVTFFHPKIGWPFDTMMRYHAYALRRSTLLQEDYIYCCDADMLFVNTVGDEIFGDLVATLHPGFVHQRGSYESNPHSTAFVGPDEGVAYFAGGFYGGKAKRVMEMVDVNIAHIEEDLHCGMIAVWHDESHWNRYCIDNPPTLILTPSYCYPEELSLPYEKKLLALCKNHSEYQK